MLHIERERLPDSFLLILEDSGPGPERALEQGLYRAIRSGKRAIWVDCSLISDLSPEAAELLLAYQGHLPHLGIELVLSHVSAPVQQALQLAAQREPLPRIVPSLLDAPASGNGTSSGPEQAM